MRIFKIEEEIWSDNQIGVQNVNNAGNQQKYLEVPLTKNVTTVLKILILPFDHFV